MRLCERISHDKLWSILEQAVIQTVISGGIAAMGFYRDVWKRQSCLNDEQKNPSTMADLEATVSIGVLPLSLPRWKRPSGRTALSRPVIS
jgi:hypothetical protein